jgi:hypothetical protein
MVMMGSPTVLINSMMACRVMDMVIEIPGGPNPIAMGAGTVFIGDVGTVMIGAGAPGASATAGGTASPRSALPQSVAAAQAQTLIEAAKAGVPFCEKCQQSDLASTSGASSASSKMSSQDQSGVQPRDGSGQDAGQGVSAGAAMAPALSAQQGTSASTEPAGRKTWVEIKLVNKQGAPVAGRKYRVTPPNGPPIEGTLDATGTARVDNIDPGSCKVTFPDLDGSEWKPV